jgi:hypothetical protein
MVQNGGQMIGGIGIILILFGIVSILWGDREIPVKGGLILRLFSRRAASTKLAKWLIGIAAIYAGIKFIFHG